MKKKKKKSFSIQIQKQEKIKINVLATVKQEEFPPAWEIARFFASLTFSWLDEAHPHYRGQSALLSLQILLFSSKNTSQTHPQCITKYLNTLWSA